MHYRTECHLNLFTFLIDNALKERVNKQIHQNLLQVEKVISCYFQQVFKNHTTDPLKEIIIFDTQTTYRLHY